MIPMPRRTLAFVGTLVALAPLAALAQPAKRPSAPQAPRFAVDPLWPKPMPNRWILGSVTGVAVDSRDHVYVLNIPDYFTARTEIGSGTNPPTGECCTPAPAVLEYDAAGALVGHWGGPGDGYDWPTTPTGFAVDAKGNVWVGGAGGNDTRILIFSRDGKFVASFGKPGAPPVATAPAASNAAVDTAYTGASGAVATGRGGRGGGGGRGRGRGGAPALPPNSASTDLFGGASNFGFDPAGGDVYVADGSRNRRVAVVDATTGAIKRFWGAGGNAPSDERLPNYVPGASFGQFGTPVRCAEPSSDGMIYVCDRANDRIQVFKKDGSFVKEKVVAPNTLGEGSVWDIAFSRDPQQRYLYVADGANMKVWILDRQSLEVITSFGDGGRQPGLFYAVHSIATDSKGNIYTGETYEGKRVQKFVFKGVGPVVNRAVVWPTSAGTGRGRGGDR